MLNRVGTLEKLRVIVKFSRRKDARRAISHKKTVKNFDKDERMLIDERLKNCQLYLNESLCPYYRGLWGQVKELYQNKRISSFFISNGTVKVRPMGVSYTDKGIAITHD